MMTSAQVVETSLTTTDNSPSQDYTHPDDQITLLHVNPGLKPFTVLFIALHTCYVSYHVTWIGPFSKWPSIKRQKKFVENLVLHNISCICSFRIFDF